MLLATTSVPLWSRSKLLGAVFISSAMSTSSALISLVLRLTSAPVRTLHKLERLEWTALLLEMSGLLAFLRQSGRAAHPLVGGGSGEHGATFWRFVFGGGLALPWLLQTLTLIGRPRTKPRRGARHPDLPARSHRRLPPATHHDRGRTYLQPGCQDHTVERETTVACETVEGEKAVTMPVLAATQLSLPGQE